MWQNSKTQIVTVVMVTVVTLAVVKVVILTIVTVAVLTVVIVTYFIKTTWHLDNQWDVIGAAVHNSCDVFN